MAGTALSSAATPSLSQISCGTKSLTGAQSKACSVYLTQAASSWTKVTLTSSNAALALPTTVTVPAGAKTGGFVVVASAVSKAASVTITGSSSGATKTDVITLYPAVTNTASLSKVSCGTLTLTGPTTKACSVYLSAAASSQVKVSLSSNNSSLQVPVSVTVPAGATTGGFALTAAAVSTTQTATLTASSNGVSKTDVLQLEGGSGSQPTAGYQVQLSWNAPNTTDTITGYRVYRAAGGTTSYQLLNSTLDGNTSFTDSGVQGGKSYDYQVTSVDSKGSESAPSNAALFTIP
ncbi:MAG TPA: fibronectin type III domain-containing protein [Terracidiphilus sp.]